jgi:hypothetical protein
MEKVDRRSLGLFVLTLPWALLRFLGRVVRRFFLVLGVLVALAVVAYVEFEFIVETIDSRYSRQIDAHLGIDKNAISRLHDPAYFAGQSVIVSEDQKTVACISSPEHRILINDPAEIPLFFTNAILASEDKNFFTHEGIDKGAIVRALVKRILQESRSGASTLTMQIAKHLRGGTGRRSTEKEKIGDIIMAGSASVFTPVAVIRQYTAAGRASKQSRRLRKPQDLALHQRPSSWLINKPALPDRHSRWIRCQGRTVADRIGQLRGTTRVLGLMLDQAITM